MISPNGSQACKIGDGSFEKGHHDVYLMAAETALEMYVTSTLPRVSLLLNY